MSWLATDGLGGDYVIFTAHNSGRPQKKKKKKKIEDHELFAYLHKILLGDLFALDMD